jgi:iron complex transport system ATP-binding protein
VKEGPVEEIITSPVLKEIYEMDIDIQTINGNRICVYF